VTNEPKRGRGAARAVLLAALGMAACGGASAYGPAGHRIAGLAAEPRLCAKARAGIDTLAPGRGLDEIGLWADRVREDPRWQRSAPWHYMNIADGASLVRHRHPPEGDVLWAIGRFRTVLADRGRPRAERLTALRFLVHFIVDVHQPLHVGRAEDRGGNTITVHFGGEAMSLHRFWDTEAIGLGRRSVAAYAAALPRRAAGSLDPQTWAAESLALRSEVYDFDRRRGVLPAVYVRRARTSTARRLAAAAARLAATLNAIWCG
jgi:hypothetical protein